jgi:hypothetical protein
LGGEDIMTPTSPGLQDAPQFFRLRRRTGFKLSGAKLKGAVHVLRQSFAGMGKCERAMRVEFDEVLHVGLYIIKGSVVRIDPEREARGQRDSHDQLFLLRERLTFISSVHCSAA